MDEKIMKQNQLIDICRTCLSKEGVMMNIFHQNDESLQYHRMIMQCTQLVIEENDDLPYKICSYCVSDVLKLFSFKNQCEKADRNIRLFLENAQFELQSLRDVKSSIIVPELCNYVDDNIETNINDLNLLNKKTRTRSSKEKLTSISKQSKKKLSKLKNIHVNLNDDIVKYNDNFNYEDSNSDEVIKISKGKKKRDINTKIKQKPRVTAFGCRKCDMHFLTWQELEKHNTLHIYDKNTQKLSCRYCNEAFLHQRHILPHIRKVHSEIERFQCGYCDERWKDMISLKSHLSTHSAADINSSKVNKFDPESSENNKTINKHIESEFEQNSFPAFVNISNESNNLICYKCRKLFLDLETLQHHISTEHSEENKNADYESNLEIHDPFNQIEVSNNDRTIENNEIGLGFIKNDSESYSDHVPELMKFSDDAIDNKNSKTQQKLDCSICNKSFRSLTDLQRHETTHDPDKPYHCKFGRCRWTFATEHELDVHTNINHMDGSFECKFCHKTFKQARNLRQHMLQHKLTKRFECKHCKRGFNHLHHLQNHERVHTGDMPFLCQSCGRSFATKDRLIFHIRRHSDDRPFSCAECEKKFVSSTELKKHAKIHSADRLFMCSICGKTFTAKYNLTKHARTRHVGSMIDDRIMFSCNMCGFNAETIQNLDQHMKSHTCQYFCQICPKSFPLTSALDAHIKTHSMGDRSHKCEVCGWAFNRAEHLRAHIARRHTKEGRLTCKHCSCTFARTPDLTAHMRTHSNQKPYICSECGRGFAQSGALLVHLRIHSGERPYICGICHKGNRSAGALAVHMRTHSSQSVQTESQTNSEIMKLDVDKLIETTDDGEHSTVIKHIESITPVKTIDFQDLRELQSMSKITKDITDDTDHGDSIDHPSTLSLEQLVVDSDNINIIDTVDASGGIMFISDN